LFLWFFFHLKTTTWDGKGAYFRAVSFV
jgi:hypothetical protein